MKNTEKRYKRKKNIVPERFDTKIKTGLSSEQVLQRKKMGFDNPEKNKKSRSFLGIIMSELLTYFNLIFFVIAIILMVVGAYTQLTFLVVVIANLVIGIAQKIKSKIIVDKLSLVTASMAKVVRDGKEQEIQTTDIVLDDIIILTSGQQITCDSIVQSGELRVNESLLTGESLPVLKKPGDTVLSGSFVVSGTAYVKADKVGLDTFVLSLTDQAKQYKKPNSIILSTLNRIIKIIGIMIIPIALLLFYQTYTHYTGAERIYDTVIKTSGAIIGMIPSGLFLLTSTALVVGVMRLAKQKILVQELYCIEMLARVNVVCMDKTGTITDGSMVVKETVQLEKYDDKTLSKIVKTILATLDDENDTAKALKKYFKPEKVFETGKYYNFSSETKFSCVEIKSFGSIFMGAPEILLNKEKYAKVLEQVNNYAGKGYRVLAVCSYDKLYDGEHKPDVSPMGLILLEDNVREDAIETIKYFKDNGVALKVISGDNPVTVSEVALRAGIDGAEKYISLENLTDEEVLKVANEYTIFGRVVPHQKKLLIQALKLKGNTVAMIGDGVNDILALREADCSIAVGAGADAARRVSQLILTDSNFCSMKSVVAEGRRVTNNIRISSPLFLTKTMFSVIFSIFCIIMAYEYPFSPVQLLLMEFCAIGLPSFALALQPNRDLIKGKFLQTILIKSLIGAVVSLAIAIFLYSTPSLTGLSMEEIQSIIVVALTVNAVFVVARASWPFNFYRLIVLLVVVTLVVSGFLMLSNLYGTAIFTGTPIYNLIQIDILSPTGYKWLYISLASIPILLAIGISVEKLIEYSAKKRKSRKIPVSKDEI